MKNVNDFAGRSDSERFEAALAALDKDRILRVPPRESEIEPERAYWLIDRAILLESNTTVLLENCRIKLSDACRDNFFRTANCGFGFPDPEKVSDIHIRGIGSCVLEGADHPRAAGDGSKILACPCPKSDEDLIRLADWIPEERKRSGRLEFWDQHNHSYGTDALKPDESHYGDWRGIGILFANAENVSVENLKIVCSHGWGISFEACAYGRIEKIDFDADMSKEIDGMRMNMENQDGIDLRNGCHDILIQDITGGTGDDLIALTAIVDRARPHAGGALRSTHVMHNDWSRRETGIRNVIIRNVIGWSKGGICYVIRILPGNSEIRNVTIDNVIENSPPGAHTGGTLLLGCQDGEYGRMLPGGMRNFCVSNLNGNTESTIVLDGYIENSVFTNVVNRNPQGVCLKVERGEGSMKNVKMSGFVSAGKDC